MSNQNATHNRVTLRQSIEAALRAAIVCHDFHNLRINWEAVDSMTLLALDVRSAILRLESAAVEAAILEAWGDGP